MRIQKLWESTFLNYQVQQLLKGKVKHWCKPQCTAKGSKGKNAKGKSGVTIPGECNSDQQDFSGEKMEERVYKITAEKSQRKRVERGTLGTEPLMQKGRKKHIEQGECKQHTNKDGGKKGRGEMGEVLNEDVWAGGGVYGSKAVT